MAGQALPVELILASHAAQVPASCWHRAHVGLGRRRVRGRQRGQHGPRRRVAHCCRVVHCRCVNPTITSVPAAAPSATAAAAAPAAAPAAPTAALPAAPAAAASRRQRPMPPSTSALRSTTGVPIVPIAHPGGRGRPPAARHPREEAPDARWPRGLRVIAVPLVLRGGPGCHAVLSLPTVTRPVEWADETLHFSENDTAVAVISISRVPSSRSDVGSSITSIHAWTLLPPSRPPP